MAERLSPPCDCIERVDGYWVQRCSCNNSGDLATAQDWCTEQNIELRAADRDTRYAYAARYRGGPIAMASVRETESEVWRHVGAEVVMRRAGWDVVPVTVTVEDVDDG